MMRLYQQLYIAQPQTNTGQRTVGKITAPIELIEYTVLFGNRNADAIIRHPYRQLVAATSGFVLGLACNSE